MNELIEEIRAIIAERKFNYGMELLQMRHEIGRAILDSPLWKKNGKGQGKLIREVAAQLDWGERTLRYAVEFAQRYPKFETALQSSDPGHKLPAWREIVKGLPSGEERKEPEARCKGCKIHCPETE